MGFKNIIKLVADADIQIGVIKGNGLGAFLVAVIMLSMIFNFGPNELVEAFRTFKD